MNPTGKQIAAVASVQAIVCMTGFIALGVIMKFCGYPEPQDPLLHWRPMALFLREYGWLTIGVPVLWSSYAFWSQRSGNPVFDKRVVLGVGIAIALLLAWLFIYYSCTPYTRGFLMVEGAN